MSIAKKMTYLRSLGFLNSKEVILDWLLKRQSTQFNRLWLKFQDIGLEFGGPSKVFARNGYCPAYKFARQVDNVNFSGVTAWHGSIAPGGNFVFDIRKPPGLQHILDAGDLSKIADSSYDFILSSHMLEHTANPLKLIFEWKRMLKNSGILLLVLPHKDNTFDHRRPLTTLQHFIEDFRKNTPEDDTTHLKEILDLHDLSLDKSQNSPAKFRSWIENNHANRGAHHHVFSSFNAAQLINFAGLKILDIEPRRPFDIFILAEKMNTELSVDNSAFLSWSAKYLAKSPFKSDQLAYLDLTQNNAVGMEVSG